MNNCFFESKYYPKPVDDWYNYKPTINSLTFNRLNINNFWDFDYNF